VPATAHERRRRSLPALRSRCYSLRLWNLDNHRRTPPQPRSRAATTPAHAAADAKYKFCCAVAGPAARKDPAILAAPAVSAQNVIEAAASLLRAGKYEEAIAPLLEAAALAPFNASVHSDLGLAYLYCRRPSEAVPWLTRSLALRPNFAATHYHLGTALEAMGESGAALAAYHRAIALNPRDATAHARVAALLVAKGARGEAAEAYDRAAAAAGDSISGQLFRVNAIDRAGPDGRGRRTGAAAD
jgi:tetratricopeptide (TPR) repeat protein